MIYPIAPVAKPRMTRADKWKKRTPVLKYRAFADECRLRMVGVGLNNTWITFHIAMPKSWSKKKKKLMNGKFHAQRPDIDNLAKALFDALYEDDSCIAKVLLTKRWAVEGSIEIGELYAGVD